MRDTDPYEFDDIILASYTMDELIELARVAAVEMKPADAGHSMRCRSIPAPYDWEHERDDEHLPELGGDDEAEW